ncbi:MAG: cobalamin adenosyltransferase [Clostridium sp.]
MKKFITEEYLRDIYKKEPFDTYKLQQGQRLTPGAAQYLSDKRIKIQDNASNVKNKVPKNNKVQSKKIEEKQEEIITEEVNVDLKLKKKLSYKLKSMEAKFLINSREILEEDIFLAHNVMNLSKRISDIRKAVDRKVLLEDICFKECKGMNSSNFTMDLDDCFEITDFHMQLKASCSILKMHILRCDLQELKFEIIEAYENDDNEVKDRIINNVNSIINSLSQLICSAVGGKECQRKE